MSIVSVQGLRQSFGAFDVFTGVSFTIPNDARVGLVGPNGIGKTTLLRVLAGIATPNAGTVHIARDQRIGYLHQETVEAFSARHHTLYDEMLSVFADLRGQMDELRAMEEHMANGHLDDDFLLHYGELQEAVEHGGGYDYERRIERVLEGLGFSNAQWDVAIDHLSGGQKTRALLARLLLEQPDLLILDEPSNHLDMEAVEWLEKTLRSWPCALVVVSHDRYFLDKVADRIYELGRTGVEIYRGNYTAYVQQRQERWERAQQLYDAEMEQLSKELELIRRFLAWRQIDEARSRQKLLSRRLLAIGELGLLGIQGKSWSEMGLGRAAPMTLDEMSDRIRAIPAPSARPPALKMQLKPAARSGDRVVRTTELTVGYSGKPLFTTGVLELNRGDCAALIGPNGAGKTTFLKTLLGNQPPLTGQVRLGAGLRIGYFSQAHDGLPPDHSVLDVIVDKGGLLLPDARNHLARYLFRGEDVFKSVSMLSGGERGRLALAVLALEKANVLLLDEPTNHLDIPAQEVLQEVLLGFDGTLLLVSHDRYLIDQLATHIWELRDRQLHVFKGSYHDMIDARDADTQKPLAKGTPRPTIAMTPPTIHPTPLSDRKRAQRIATLETDVAEAEAHLHQLSTQIQQESEAQRFDDVIRLTDAYTEAEARLHALMTQWIEISAE